MFRYLAILAILPAIIMARDDLVSIRACNGGGHMPTWVAIQGCNTAECRIVKGEPVVVAGEVTTVNDSETLSVSMVAMVLGLELELDLPADVRDGCNVVPNGCPIHAGSTLEINASAVIGLPEINLPQATIPIEMRVVNNNGERVLCVQTDVILVEA